MENHRRSLVAALAACLALLPACGPMQDSDTPLEPTPLGARLAANVIDLTYAFGDETIYWPTGEGFSRTATSEGTTPQGYFYAAGEFSSAEHGGTHLDAPFHFSSDGWTVDAIPPDRLIGSAVVIDVTAQAGADPDYRITPEDIQQWEAEHTPLPDDVIVLLRTGWGRYWPNREQYLGTSKTGPEAVRELHFPGLDPEAAQWIVGNRNVKAIGIDTPSIDYGQSQDFRTHQILAADNIPVFENVANLDQLPVEGATVIALPMKIEGGSGGPLRIVGIAP